MNSNSGKKAKYGGALKAHWQWSVLLSLSLLILDGILLWKYPRAGLIAVIFTAVYYLAVLGIYMYLHPRIMQELVTFATVKIYFGI